MTGLRRILSALAGSGLRWIAGGLMWVVNRILTAANAIDPPARREGNPDQAQGP